MAIPNVKVRLETAAAHYRAGRFDEAERACRELLAGDAGLADAHELLGLVEFARGRHDAAATHYRSCIRLAPRQPRYPYLLGKVHTQKGGFDEALSLFDAALALDAGFVPALSWKAMVLQRVARRDEARAIVEPFINAGTDTPEMAEVFARIEQIEGRDAEAVRVIERALARPGLLPVTRQVLLALIGQSLDALGNYGRAFQSFTRANSMLKVPFDPQAYTAWVDRVIITSFGPNELASMASSGLESQEPVFIAGMPRSGTTLIEQIIDAHPRMRGVGEPRVLDDLIAGLPAGLGGSVGFPECVKAMTGEHARAAGEEYLAAFRGGSDIRWADKSLENYKHLGLISRLLPRARVIHCRRDPLDTCLSCYIAPLQGRHAYSNDLRHLGLVYRQYERLMAHWGTIFDLPVLEVRYEDLVADIEVGARRIVEFCGVEWDEACLRFHESGRTAQTLSYDQVRRPVYSSAVGRWRRYDEFLGPLREALGMV